MTIDVNDILGRLAEMRARSSRPPRRSACVRCADTGLVELDDKVPDARAPVGFRVVAIVYRCECKAGAQLKRFALAPPAERPLRLRGDDPKD